MIVLNSLILFFKCFKYSSFKYANSSLLFINSLLVSITVIFSFGVKNLFRKSKIKKDKNNLLNKN